MAKVEYPLDNVKLISCTVLNVQTLAVIRSSSERGVLKILGGDLISKINYDLNPHGKLSLSGNAKIPELPKNIQISGTVQGIAIGDNITMNFPTKGTMHGEGGQLIRDATPVQIYIYLPKHSNLADIGFSDCTIPTVELSPLPATKLSLFTSFEGAITAEGIKELRMNLQQGKGIIKIENITGGDVSIDTTLPVETSVVLNKGSITNLILHHAGTGNIICMPTIKKAYGNCGKAKVYISNRPTESNYLTGDNLMIS